MDSFSENELKVFQCFINPRYPRAVRSFGAVVKESGLSEEEVMATLVEYQSLLFAPVGPVQKRTWSFNFNYFAGKCALKYPQLFEKYHVHSMGHFLLVAPKSIPLEVVQGFINSYPKSLPGGLSQVVNEGMSAVIKLTASGPMPFDLLDKNDEPEDMGEPVSEEDLEEVMDLSKRLMAAQPIISFAM